MDTPRMALPRMPPRRLDNDTDAQIAIFWIPVIVRVTSASSTSSMQQPPDAPQASDTDSRPLLAFSHDSSEDIADDVVIVDTVAGATLLEDDVMEMCVSNDISKYVDKIDKMIRACYRDVEDIRHECVNYPDVPGYQKLCFEIHLTSTPDQATEDEDKLYAALFSSEIPKDKRNFFIFTHYLS